MVGEYTSCGRRVDRAERSAEPGLVTMVLAAAV